MARLLCLLILATVGAAGFFGALSVGFFIIS